MTLIRKILGNIVRPIVQAEIEKNNRAINDSIIDEAFESIVSRKHVPSVVAAKG